MPRKIAINGFGRIGRLTLRNLLKEEDITVVAINDLTDNNTLAHLFKYDTAHGIYPGEVSATDEYIIIDGAKIYASSERNPEALPWKDLEVDVVLECTGVFRSHSKAKMHITAGAKKVILSAPAKGGDVQTIVLGVNDDALDKSIEVYSNASCTTNCLAPLVKVLDQNYGIKQGTMTTVHAYTADQNIQDAPHSDLRRARAAAQNIVPTSTGAADAVGLVYPSIKNKISAMAVRVPVITGSLVELTVVVNTPPSSADAVIEVFKNESESNLKGILEFSTAPLVSSDIVSNKYSSIFDAELTQVNGDWIKVVAWYDNEAGYSARLADLTTKIPL